MSFTVNDSKVEAIANPYLSYKEDSEIQSITSMHLKYKVIRVVDEILQLANQNAYQGHLSFRIPLSALPDHHKFELIKDIAELDSKTLEAVTRLFNKYFLIKIERIYDPRSLELVWAANNEVLYLKPSIIIPQSSDISLGGHFKFLFNNADFSDMQIEVEGRLLYAHKVVLMRNAYFKTLFTSSNQWKETRENRIIFEECEYGLFYLFLFYLYTDEFPENELHSFDTCRKVLLFADRFQCNSLANHCKMKLPGFLPSYLDEIVELQQSIHLTELNPLCEWYKKHRLLDKK